ncbi:DUF2141 domain-containing protein [Pseudoalteromonas luteoviolacea]|uniref:DUF2141 domain-containing protein n=1 Tax=Pseudoalteromonas luteoviolacea S4054 TaxID=1129367 RepID=A0A0F6AHL9_9GAMM|nr:DUF2141 domain-containing protein [Pseudoalteromonas luteoviolacea]AOT06407.1 hypothetical protein S4054249_00205 [Pseudoalteromonas luteoviolacea]AOT11324.1 hypothetical protein S40542_00205 [Pseudoalteromonas luteoviolacea]AOT16237.1 hypothetical protein S4054_00205 [Pseudoalteromonas luteoviolacea]KKE85725.1 hypothetical protein N479_24965 [Pseudoalteromonas luteoviolacea S4054]KZN64382.1 hypothetical protein N481_25445 [Pseudoalteromonas luteoviolacea S4047-1]
MKPLISTLALLCTPVMANHLELQINNVSNESGKVYIELFKGAQNYKSGKSYIQNIIPAKAGTIKTNFSGIESGEYVIRFFHDGNGNAQLDTNFFGIPTEGVGFSNNATMQFGPPKYQDMAITINNGNNLEITSISY